VWFLILLYKKTDPKKSTFAKITRAVELGSEEPPASGI
jgi:hypothetical protein